MLSSMFGTVQMCVADGHKNAAVPAARQASLKAIAVIEPQTSMLQAKSGNGAATTTFAAPLQQLVIAACT